MYSTFGGFIDCIQIVCSLRHDSGGIRISVSYCMVVKACTFVFKMNEITLLLKHGGPGREPQLVLYIPSGGI